jgi:acetolactate decarboxylase
MQLNAIYIIFSLFIFTYSASAQQSNNAVKIIGEMRNVMWKGQLSGNINLDTISQKRNLYGFGPIEYLAGEILIIDGKPYKSSVVSDTEMKVEETYHIKAPFFASAIIENWSERPLPNKIQSIQELESYINKLTKKSPIPFMFKLSGIVEQATIHIVNLPKGSKVSSPKEAHQGQTNYELENINSDIIGFFSTQHQTIFTHHDTFLHMHLITKDRQKMGHLDKVLFKKGSMKLYMPTE